jgi:hypothetical protein
LRLELYGLLLTGATPLYLHANVTGGSGGTATAGTAAPTGPGGKIAAPRLARYLATEAPSGSRTSRP